MAKSPIKASGNLSLFFIIGIAALPLGIWNGALDAGLNFRQMLLGLLVTILVSIGFIQNKKVYAESTIPMIGWAAILWWLWGWIPHVSAISSADSLAIQLRNGSLVGLFILILLGLQNGSIKRQDIVRAGLFFGALTSFEALLRIIQALNDGSFQKDVYSIKGLFQHKNLLSGALLVSLPFSLLASVEGTKKWELKGGLVVSILIFLELFLLRTRGAWLGLVASGIILIPLSFVLEGQAKDSLLKLKKWWPAVLVIIGALAFSLRSETASSQLLNERNISHRFAFWSNTLEMAKEHPITGVGHGNWRIYFPKYGLSHTDAQVMNGITGIQRPHNDYLWILSEQGIVGLLLFFLILGLGKWSLFSSRGSDDPTVTKRHLIYWFGFISVGIFAFGDFPYERSAHMALFFLLIALMASEANSKGLAKIPVWVVLLILGGASMGSAYVARERLNAEESVNQIHAYNSRQDGRIIQAAESAENDFYKIDNYTNPLPYYAALGELYNTKNLVAAEANLDRALELHPWHILSMNQYGNLLKKKDQWEEAEKYFDMALAISPDFEMGRLNKAEALVRKKQWQEAFEWMHGCALDSRNPKLYQMASQILPEWLEEKSRNSKTQTPLARYLMPYKGDLKTLVNQYGAYRQQVKQQSTSR